MVKRKCFKSSVGAKKPFEIYNVHERDNPKASSSGNITFAVIDPGCVNCGLFICKYNIKEDQIIPLILKRLQFKDKGKSKEGSIEQYRQCIIRLNDYEEYFLKCQYIVIESQIGFAFNNVKIAMFIMGYFMTKYQNKGKYPFIVELNSSDKIRVLGCELKEKSDYKKWSVGEATRLLTEVYETDDDCISSITSKGKKDDKADTVCMAEIYKRYLKNAMTKDPIFLIPLPL